VVIRSLSLSVAVLGAGHGGLALAGYLSQRGHHVALWNRSPERVEAVAARGGIVLTSPGPVSAFARIDVATSDMARALADARLVLVAVPASGHADVATACAPYLRDGQTVLLLPGRTGGTLEFRAALNRAGCKARIVLGEANTFPFAARGVGPASAVIYGSKAEVLAAALPATRTPELIAVCKAALPMLAPAPSVMHTSLANVGAILHPIIALLNADRIARGVSFDFYADGVTETVAETLAAADAERLQIARAYGIPEPSLIEWVETAYGHRADDVRGAIGGNPSYVGIKAPNTLQHRYLTEDVPTGLIPLIALGRAAGLELPTLTRIAERCQDILGGEPWQRPRTLEALGLAGLGKFGIRALVERGPAPVTRQSIRVTPFDGRSRPTMPVAVPTLIRSVSA
jgi:opine dehydrogenase